MNVVHCDNYSVIYLTKNHIYNERTKHIDITLFKKLYKGAVSVKLIGIVGIQHKAYFEQKFGVTLLNN